MQPGGGGGAGTSNRAVVTACQAGIKFLALLNVYQYGLRPIVRQGQEKNYQYNANNLGILARGLVYIYHWKIVFFESGSPEELEPAATLDHA